MSLACVLVEDGDTGFLIALLLWPLVDGEHVYDSLGNRERFNLASNGSLTFSVFVTRVIGLQMSKVSVCILMPVPIDFLF